MLEVEHGGGGELGLQLGGLATLASGLQHVSLDCLRDMTISRFLKDVAEDTATICDVALIISLTYDLDRRVQMLPETSFMLAI